MPLRSSMRSVGDAVKAAPDSLLQTVDGVVGGLSRAIRGPTGPLRQQTDTQLLRDPALLDTEVRGTVILDTEVRGHGDTGYTGERGTVILDTEVRGYTVMLDTEVRGAR